MRMPARLTVTLGLSLWIVGCAADGGLSSDPGALRANYLITVTDDFIVNVYHNGRRIPDSKRRMLLERFGATVERIDVPVHEGDWLVFNVVNNRLRWGGAYYFGVAGAYSQDEFGFVSELESGQWSVCDDPAKVNRFIAERNYMRHEAAQAVSRPWHEGLIFMRRYAGQSWAGQPVWGTSRNTWVKVVLPR